MIDLILERTKYDYTACRDLLYQKANGKIPVHYARLYGFPCIKNKMREIMNRGYWRNQKHSYQSSSYYQHSSLPSSSSYHHCQSKNHSSRYHHYDSKQNQIGRTKSYQPSNNYQHSTSSSSRHHHDSYKSTQNEMEKEKSYEMPSNSQNSWLNNSQKFKTVRKTRKDPPILISPQDAMINDISSLPSLPNIVESNSNFGGEINVNESELNVINDPISPQSSSYCSPTNNNNDSIKSKQEEMPLLNISDERDDEKSTFNLCSYLVKKKNDFHILPKCEQCFGKEEYVKENNIDFHDWLMKNVLNIKIQKVLHEILKIGYDSPKLFDTLLSNGNDKQKSLKTLMSKYNVTIGVAIKMWKIWKINHERLMDEQQFQIANAVTNKETDKQTLK